jgi:hypothetical protein
MIDPFKFEHQSTVLIWLKIMNPLLFDFRVFFKKTLHLKEQFQLYFLILV